MLSPIITSTYVIYISCRPTGDDVRPHPPELNCDDRERHKTLKIGSKIRLTCPVKSEGTYWVTWMKDGHEIKQGWTRYRISRRGVLRISSTQASDAGAYVCRGINGFGTTEFTYQLGRLHTMSHWVIVSDGIMTDYSSIIYRKMKSCRLQCTLYFRESLPQLSQTVANLRPLKSMSSTFLPTPYIVD